MRYHFSSLLVCLVIGASLLASGCGESKDKSSTGSGGATQTTAGSSGSTATGTTGSSGSTAGGGDVGKNASKTAKQAYDNCMAAAENLQDDETQRTAKQACKSAYDAVNDATKNIDQKLSEAARNCKQQARQLENEEARNRALDACAQIK